MLILSRSSWTKQNTVTSCKISLSIGYEKVLTQLLTQFNLDRVGKYYQQRFMFLLPTRRRTSLLCWYCMYPKLVVHY